MKVICLRKSISHGPHKLVRDQVADVPDVIAKDWIAAGYVKEAPAAEASLTSPPPAEPHRNRRPRQ